MILLNIVLLDTKRNIIDSFSDNWIIIHNYRWMTNDIFWRILINLIIVLTIFDYRHLVFYRNYINI